jgi:drug/metabolite transporter (DMT)-like permease
MVENKAFLGLIAGTFIGFSLVTMSVATKSVHPFVYSAYSTALSIPFLFALSYFYKGAGLREIVRNKSRDFWLTLFERFILGSGILLTFGFSMTSAIRGVFIVQLEPMFVLLWSFMLLHERVRKSKVFFFVTLILGAFLITTGGMGGEFSTLLVGDGLIALAVLLLAHSFLTSSRLMERANPFRLYLGFSVLSLPVFIALSLLLLPVASFFISMEMLAVIFMGSIFFNIIGFPLWLISLKYMRPWAVSTAIMVQSISGALLSFFWLGQTLSVVQIIGGIVILISVYFISLKG